MKSLNERIKRLNVLDLILIELYSIAFLLFALSKWTNILIYVILIDWWWYLVIFFVLAYKPMKKLLF